MLHYVLTFLNAYADFVHTHILIVAPFFLAAFVVSIVRRVREEERRRQNWFDEVLRYYNELKNQEETTRTA